jgi:hypothetical protein
MLVTPKLLTPRREADFFHAKNAAKIRETRTKSVRKKRCQERMALT